MERTPVRPLMSSSEKPPNVETIRLAAVCGEHCLDFQSVNALVLALPKEGGAGSLRISFQDVGAVSTAFGSSLLTSLDDWKRARPGRRVVLCDLSIRHQRVIEACRSALQASSASISEKSDSGHSS